MKNGLFTPIEKDEKAATQAVLLNKGERADRIPRARDFHRKRMLFVQSEDGNGGSQRGGGHEDAGEFLSGGLLPERLQAFELVLESGEGIGEVSRDQGECDQGEQGNVSH